MSVIKTNLIVILLLLMLSSYTKDDNSSDYQYIKQKYRVKKVSFNTDLNAFLIEKRGKCGLVSSKEMEYKLLIPMEYDSILPQASSYHPILVWDEYKTGLYTSDYRLLLEPEYHNVRTNEYNEGFIEISHNNKRGIYDLRYEKFIISPEYDNIEFLDYKYSAGLLIVRKKGKLGLLNIYKHKLVFDIEYDKIIYHHQFAKDVNGTLYESYVEFVSNGKRKYYNGDNLYDEIKLNGYSKQNMGRLEFLNADTLVECPVTVKGEFIARNQLSQKWGMYENYDDIFKVIIPAKYDKLDFYEWGAPLTIIHKNNFVGYFVKEWEENLDEYPQTCIYNELKIVDDDKYRKFLAARINDKWYWIDWYVGTYNKNQYYDTFEEMQPSEDNLSEYYKK